MVRLAAARLAAASWTIATLGSVFGPPAAVSVGDGVEIRSAGSKGLGAFVTRDLPAGTYLAPYTGRLLASDEAMLRAALDETSGDYFASLNGWFDEELVIDAEDPKTSGWPRYINHSKRRANCKNIELQQPVALPGGGVGRLPLGLYAMLIRDVQAGEELLVDYGSAYWTDRGLLPLDPRRIAIDYI